MLCRNLCCLTLVLVSVFASIVFFPSESSSQTLKYSNTWLGNSFGGAPYTTVGGWSDAKHMQLSLDDMVVDADGTVYTDSGWDEGGNESGIYKNDDLIGRCQELSHGWGRSGGQAVAVSTDYVYVAMFQNGDDGADARLNDNGIRRYPDKGVTWACVRRFHKNGVSAPFPAGFGIFDDMMIVATFPSSDRATGIHGLAVHGNSLFVSVAGQNQISVYDTATMNGKATESWTVPSAGKIVFDDEDRLWLLSPGASKLVCYDTSGKLLPKEVTFPPTILPASIAWDAAANRLLVADDGVDQNIKFYNVERTIGISRLPPQTLGVKGGIHSGVDGKPGPLRFFDISDVGVDAAGNIYVCNNLPIPCGRGVSLGSYKPNGDLNWPTPLRCLEFVNNDDSDPLSDTNVYSTDKHYHFVYSLPAGAGWQLAGLTIDRFRYPDDFRLHCDFSGGVWVRRINGAPYLFLTQQMGHMIGVLRLSSSPRTEIATPYAVFSQRFLTPDSTGWPASQPGSANASTEWIWRDSNGDGKMDAGEYSSPAAGSPSIYDAGWGNYVDSAGNIWQSGHGHIREFKMHLDAKGLPVWDYASGDAIVSAAPALPDGAVWQHGSNGDDDDMDRVIYEPETDTMYVGGFTSAHPDDTDHHWGLIGRVLYRYDRWSGARAIHPGYPAMLPWGTQGAKAAKSIAIAGSYVFAVQAGDPEMVTVYNTDTAAVAGTMQPGPEVGNHSGWVDANNALTAHKRADGEYILFAEEDYLEKSLIYRWPSVPLDR